MNSRERIATTLAGGIPDRVGKIDFIWRETLARWHTEGLPEEVDHQDYFGFDVRFLGFEQRLGLQEKVLDEDDEYRTVLNTDGAIEKIPLRDCSLITLTDLVGIPVRYTIRDRKTWEEHKPLLVASKERWLANNAVSSVTGAFYYVYSSPEERQGVYDRVLEDGRYLCLSIREPWENIRTKVGTQRLLELVGEDPALTKEMFERDADMTINMIELLADPELHIEFDAVWIWGDIAYNKGMMFSPRAYRELLMPAHKRIFDFCHARGKPIIYHSDGKLDQLLPLLVEVGIDAIQPIEVKAGNDVLKIKRRYGDRLTLIGGIDARLMVDREAIDREMHEKMPGLKAGGRYIWYSDHSVPPDVSFDNYRFLMGLVEELGRYSAGLA